MEIKRFNIKLQADPKRVLLQPFAPGSNLRIEKIIQRVLWLTNEQAEKVLSGVMDSYSKRHKDIEKRFLDHFKLVETHLGDKVLPKVKKILLGAYFSKEYSVESAALFNPSIVPHPDQSNMKEGQLKFVLSLRATGEGHISSIEFREGIISEHGDIKLKNSSRFVVSPTKRSLYKGKENSIPEDKKDANYDIEFSGYEELSERVIFPYSHTESNGIEDVRFVKFNDDNESNYYGTFTAYDGRRILSELISTKDFKKFSIRTFEGNGAKDKGMALFPEKIKNSYMMISREDGENLFIMDSDNLYNWNDSVILKEPELDWQFVQIGNCGSPIKTNKGWILLTHAVGPVRTYVISALLLDLENPSKIIGTLDEPLISPNENEREGYVSNVVYSCGSLIHKENLIIPYAMSDSASSFASVNVNKLLSSFRQS